MKQNLYNVEDCRYHLIGLGVAVHKTAEIDPTQAVALTDGRSPLVINSAIFSDELSMNTGGKEKIFDDSSKDQ